MIHIAEDGEVSASLTVKWGIIGVGQVCEVKSAPGMYLCENSELVAVMRRNGAAAKDFADRHGVKKSYDNMHDLINDEEVNAIYIASPPGTHLEIALECLKSKKPCYIEKPMARNATETRQIVEAFAAAGVPLYSAYYRRGHERFHVIKKMIAEGKIGDIVHVHYEMIRPLHVYKSGLDGWRFQPQHSGGGLIMDVGVHTLDILDFLVGEISDVHGHAQRVANEGYSVEDSVAMCFKIGPALGTASWNFAGSSFKDLIVIHGNKGTLSFSTFQDDPVVLRTADPDHVGDFNAHKENIFEFDLPKHAQQPLIQMIVDHLLQKSDICPSSGENALRVAVVVDAALESYYKGRHDKFWERPETWGPDSSSK